MIVLILECVNELFMFCYYEQVTAWDDEISVIVVIQSQHLAISYGNLMNRSLENRSPE